MDSKSKEDAIESSSLQAVTEYETNREINTLDQGELDSSLFNTWSTIGVQYSVTASPIAIGSFLQLVVGAGGSPYFFWCMIVAMTGQFFVAFSITELASAFPHTAGTVYWVLMLAPRRYHRFLSYFNGVSVCLGWLFVLSATIAYTGVFATGIGSIATPNYTLQLWHTYLAGIASIVPAIIFNTYGIRLLPSITKFTIAFVNAFTIFLFVTLLAKTHPKASPSTVFIDVVNNTGWSSNGLVFLLALLPGVSVIGMFDGAAHLAEELPRPEKQVPQVIIYTNILNAVAVFVMVLVLLFYLVHPERILDPMAGLPIAQLCWDAWPSVGFVVAVIVCYYLTNALAATCAIFPTSRLFWSFAKTGALPFSGWISRVNGQRVPANAVGVTGVLSAIVVLLILGPHTVLNGILGSAVILMSISYSMPIVLLLLKGRSVLPANRGLNLGRFGFAVNLFSLAWIVIVAVFLSFPMYRPVTADNMNWAAPCALGLLALVMVNWMFYRKSYRSLHGLYIEGFHDSTTAGLQAGKGTI